MRREGKRRAEEGEKRMERWQWEGGGGREEHCSSYTTTS